MSYTYTATPKQKCETSWSTTGRSPGLSVSQIRDLLGTTRKFAVPICEHLDRVGFTRREGDLRIC